MGAHLVCVLEAAILGSKTVGVIFTHTLFITHPANLSSW